MPDIEFSLQHLTGPRRGREERFREFKVGIGRGRANQMTFDPVLDRTVSAKHAEIRAEEGMLVLYDLGSLNGTFVNGAKVRRSILADGDEIGLGREGPRLRLMFRTGGTPDPIVPGDIPPGILVGGGNTADAPRIGRVPDAVGRPTKIPLSAIVVAGFSVLAVAGWLLYRRLEDRLDGISGRGVQGVGRFATLAAGLEPDQAGTLLLRGQQGTESTAVSIDLGTAILGSDTTAVTTASVFATIRKFLSENPGARIVALPGGRADLASELAGWREATLSGAGIDATLVLLDSAAPLVPGAHPASLGGDEHLGQQGVLVRRPGFAAMSAAIEESTTFKGERAAVNAADLISIRNLPPVGGLPIVDGRTGALIAISLGAEQPGLALAARHVAMALKVGGTPTPLRR